MGLVVGWIADQPREDIAAVFLMEPDEQRRILAALIYEIVCLSPYPPALPVSAVSRLHTSCRIFADASFRIRLHRHVTRALWIDPVILIAENRSAVFHGYVHQVRMLHGRMLLISHIESFPMPLQGGP